MLLVLGACLGLGYVTAREQRRRLRTLDGLEAALGMMEAELQARAAALPELAAFLALRTRGGAARFFGLLAEQCAALGERPFSSLWSECVLAALPELRETEKQALMALGVSLGRYSLERQAEALRRCRALLHGEAQSARESFTRDRRLIWGLSAAGGALLLILLL